MEDPLGRIETGATIMLPSRHPLRLTIENSDGEAGRRFAPGRPVEIWLCGLEQPTDPNLTSGRLILEPDRSARAADRWVMPITFPNYQLADQAAAALAAVLPHIETLARAPIPTRDDGHKHKIRFERFSRNLAPSAVCELCMTTLVDDINAWAVDPDRRLEPVAPAGHGSLLSLRTIIEEWANR